MRIPDLMFFSVLQEEREEGGKKEKEKEKEKIFCMASS
jgi:hypothetical protein